MNLADITDAQSITLTGVEFKALYGEIKTAQDRAVAAEAKVVTAEKTAAEKVSPLPKLATDLAGLLVARGQITADRRASLEADMVKDGRIHHYMKFALDMNDSLKAELKIAKDQLAVIPTRVGRVVEKVSKVAASTTTASSNPELSDHMINGRGTSVALAEAGQKMAAEIHRLAGTTA